MSKTKIYVAVPTTGTVSDMHPHCFRQWEREYGDRIEFVYPKSIVQRKFHDFARNAMVEDFLATDCDILWFVDSDVVPPPNVLDLVTKHGDFWELAGAPYPVFMQPAGYDGPQAVLCVYKSDATGMHAARVPSEGTAFVDGLATGCLFIRREVFLAMSKPYFEFKFEHETRHVTEGEDLGFCRKAHELGYQFFTDYSMVCKHYKTVDLLDVNNYAVEFAQASVEAYDAQIRPQVEALVEKVKTLSAEKRATKSSLILPPGLI